ncbi:MAG: methane monooxygenase/ammonia monooxygenase subunit A [Thaumarchaeota archaeon]|nr:methane monooxygenase/ammonia monooxygenase subunit A [Candidatus Calditenuaceae archaeon]MDW8187366.1 methane monooxygenase/ammonia monooxygenase subunit A [Nitrososphaerota archaeon]
MAQPVETQPIFFTRTIRWIAFTATLIFSQNMLTVSSQIGVGDWEFWIDWKDWGFAPFVFTWLVATHFPIYSLVFKRFFNLYFGATMTFAFWYIQRNIMVYFFFVEMNNYPFNYVQVPSYLFSALATDLTLFVMKDRHPGLYILISSSIAGALTAPSVLVWHNLPFMMTEVAYPDPVNPETTHIMPIWYLIRMVVPKAPIPAYISEAWSWPHPYRSFYEPIQIMAGTMGVMGAIWAGFTYIFYWAIFRGVEKTTKYFQEQ